MTKYQKRKYGEKGLFFGYYIEKMIFYATIKIKIICAIFKKERYVYNQFR